MLDRSGRARPCSPGNPRACVVQSRLAAWISRLRRSSSSAIAGSVPSVAFSPVPGGGIGLGRGSTVVDERLSASRELGLLSRGAAPCRAITAAPASASPVASAAIPAHFSFSTIMADRAPLTREAIEMEMASTETCPSVTFMQLLTVCSRISRSSGRRMPRGRSTRPGAPRPARFRGGASGAQTGRALARASP